MLNFGKKALVEKYGPRDHKTGDKLTFVVSDTRTALGCYNQYIKVSICNNLLSH